MNKILKVLFACSIVTAGILFHSSCNTPTETEETADETEKSYPVETQVINYQIITRTLEYSSDLLAFKEVNYAPSQPARIKKIYVDVGDRVHTGKLLAVMDNTQLTQALSQLESAKSSFRRIDTLYSLGSISEQQYEQAKTQYEVALSNVEFLRENTKLVSPITGIVTEKYYESGELYTAAPNPQTGKSAIVSLMQIHPLKAVVYIPQSYFPQIKEGMEVELSSAIFPDKTFKASVYKKYPVIEKATRSFKTELKINNPKEQLRPGMSADIVLKLKQDSALMVPANAVLKQEGTNNRYIFVNNQGKAKQVYVKTGKRENDLVEITASELLPGSELITEGHSNLLNGYKIKVRK
jgi:RND family efflux transporter MFP subunit